MDLQSCSQTPDPTLPGAAGTSRHYYTAAFVGRCGSARVIRRTRGGVAVLSAAVVGALVCADLGNLIHIGVGMKNAKDILSVGVRNEIDLHQPPIRTGTDASA